MNRVLHLARADVRRWLGLIGFAAALTIAMRVLDEAAPVYVLQHQSAARMVDSVVLLMALAQALVAFVIVALVVHETPLVDARAFWMTRPLTGRDVLLAKLLTLGVVLIALPVLVDTFVLWRRGAPSDRVLLDMLEELVGWRLLGLLVLLLAAALTRSLASYLVSLTASLVGLFAFALISSLFWRVEDPPHDGPPPPPIGDPADVLPGFLALLLTFGVPLVVLILTRRPSRAIAALAVLLAVNPVPDWLGLSNLLTPVQVTPPAWATDPTSLHLRMGPSIPGPIDAPADAILLPQRVVGQATPRPLHAALYATPPPAGYFAEVVDLRARFTTADGATVSGRGSVRQQQLASRPGERVRNRFDAWQIAAGRNARIEVLEPPHAAPLVPLAFSALETLATIERPEDAERLLRGTVRCETDVVFDLWTHRLAAVVEGAPSRVAQDGWLLEISAIRRGPQEVSILVRETAVVPLLRLAIPPGWHVALKKPGEAVMLAGNESSPHGTFWQALALAPLGHWTFYPASEEPARSRWRVFTFYRETGLPHTIDWIDRAQIAVVRTDYAGRVTRRLRVDRLTVREPPVPATP